MPILFSPETPLLTGVELSPRQGPAQQLVVLLHGLGDSGYGLLPLAEVWQAQLPHAHFVALHAPERCTMAPADALHSYQWFNLTDWSPFNISQGAARAAPALAATLAHWQTKLGLTPAATALVGFSQGAMMAMYVAPRLQPALAGVVAYAGALVGAETLVAELVSRPPMLLVHGQLDEVVPYAAMPMASAALASLGCPVKTETRPMLGHSIDDGGLRIGGEFLAGLWRARPTT